MHVARKILKTAFDIFFALSSAALNSLKYHVFSLSNCNYQRRRRDIAQEYGIPFSKILQSSLHVFLLIKLRNTRFSQQEALLVQQIWSLGRFGQTIVIFQNFFFQTIVNWPCFGNYSVTVKNVPSGLFEHMSRTT